jgi:hypothetical protein
LFSSICPFRIFVTFWLLFFIIFITQDIHSLVQHKGGEQNMRKNVIYSIPCKRRGILQFYFKAHDKTYYLYYIRYRKKAHEFFRYGKSISELHRRKDWKKSPFLRNLIEGPLKQKVNQMKKGGI